ncbi:MAG TPA: DUF4360 domain-containing protein [Actinoplanes sp.]
MAMGGAVVSMLAVTVLAAPAAAQVAAPDDVRVQVVTVNGSGCPAGAGTAVLSADREFVTVTSPAYFAQAGGTARPIDFRRNCQFSVQVTRPAGWTFAVSEVQSSGYAFLAAGATGVSRVSFYFQGFTPTTARTNTFEGPWADAWRTTDTIEPAARTFLPCGAQRNLNVNTELRVLRDAANPSVSSFMVRGEQTGLRLTWREC